MSIGKTIRKAIKRTFFGENLIPQRVFLGQQSPQSEVGVWLDGMGEPIDVTGRHTIACADPFVLCLAFSKDKGPSEQRGKRLTLKFCERDGKKQILAKIGLKLVDRLAMGEREFFFFHVRDTANYCLPPLRRWAYYLLFEHIGKITNKTEIKPNFLEKRALEIMFVCPRPISLMSTVTDIKGNMFPVNVMGDIDQDYFAFSLRHAKMPAHLVGESGRIALSSVPLEQGSFAYNLASNHNKQSIDWYELPFETRKTETFHIPFPSFAYRVREMEIEKALHLGSHVCFIARVVSDVTFSEGTELFVVHGLYEAWRLKKSNSGWDAALAEDARVKADAPIRSSAV